MKKRTERNYQSVSRFGMNVHQARKQVIRALRASDNCRKVLDRYAAIPPGQRKKPGLHHFRQSVTEGVLRRANQVLGRALYYAGAHNMRVESDQPEPIPFRNATPRKQRIAEMHRDLAMAS